jgi:hypothetical protein
VRGRVTLALLFSAFGSAAAQTPSPCAGQRIDSIAIDVDAPSVSGLRRVPIVYDVVRNTHVTTRAEVIRGYLLLRVGDRCDELRRSESERILRAQPFIADATIDVQANTRGGVTLDVHTIDESSIILSGGVRSSTPQVRSVKVGSGNVAGLGILASLAWRHEPHFDDRLHVRLADYQFAGRPYVLSLASLRDPFGRDDRAEMTLPFRTDVQRIAWRTLIGESRGHAAFTQRDSGRLTLGYGREYAEMGGIARVGPPGKLSLFGLSLTNERVWPDSGVRLITDTGFRVDTAAGFVRFAETRAARVNALLGVRGIRFMRVRGYDALRGLQDVPLGLQFGTLVGRGIEAFGSNSNDVFVASDLYIGVGNQRITYRLQAQAEGRRVRGSDRWDGLIGSGRISRYLRVSSTRTRMMSVEWSGTERVLVPHSFSLGVPDGGMRGLRNSPAIGGRRGIARVDEHFFLGTPFNFGDLGMGWFVDAGQLWKGDLPYGESTRLRAAAGVSLLLAVPMRSTRMWRLEFAAPLNRERGGKSWELRLSHADKTTFFWREPPDVDAARSRAVPASIYSWP